MFYTYVLQSLKNFDIYVGSTEDIATRVKRHNSGNVRSTKPNRPWKLLQFEKFETRREAVRHEKFLKTGQQKEQLRAKYGMVAKW